VSVDLDVGVGVDGVGDVDLVGQSLTAHHATRPSKRSDQVQVAVALNVAVNVNLNVYEPHAVLVSEPEHGVDLGEARLQLRHRR
jgi:hypothetical protein